MLSNGESDLKQIKESILTHASVLFEIPNIQITLLGYAANVKVYCMWISSIVELQDCINNIGTINSLPDANGQSNLISALIKSLKQISIEKTSSTYQLSQS